ncbi:MAG: helix-turn-helix transcriptional regulator [Nocardioidaceae bacterium]
MTNNRVLGALGVSSDEEHLYRVLLTCPGSTTAELRELSAVGDRRLRAVLAELEGKALITRRGGTPARFQPAPPDIVVEALISAREEELSQARLDVPQLMGLLRTPPTQLRATELVEILTSREAVVERWMQLQRATRGSLEGFMRPPVAQPRVDDDESLQAALFDHGVTSRVIYDQDALRHPGILEHVRRMTELGEHARVVTRLPLKLALFDRRTALVPTHMDAEGGTDAGLVVHNCALLDALVVLFDIYWERGTDVQLDHHATDTSPGTADENTVLTLLAAGLKDEAMAHQLGVSPQTVRRRITAIHRRLGVTSRFQAGLALGRQGWRNQP